MNYIIFQILVPTLILATSPLYVALRVLETGIPGADSYLEELIVRRELAMNFVYYNPNYDKFNSIPKWAHDTLLKHQSDRREYIYSRKELEIAETRDAYWNACQKEMVHKGKLHGYLGMY